MELINQMIACQWEKIEQINEIETEAANASIMSLPSIPGKSLGLQFIESAAEHLGWEGAGHVVPYVDYVFLLWDVGEQVWDYNEFKQKLKDVEQHGCGCEPKGTNK
jgi:hypothetical protein